MHKNIKQTIKNIKVLFDISLFYKTKENTQKRKIFNNLLNFTIFYANFQCGPFFNQGLHISLCFKIINEFKSTAIKLFFSPFTPLTNHTMKQILHKVKADKKS